MHKVARTILWKKMLGARAAEEERMKGERGLVNFQVLSHRRVSQKLWALHPAHEGITALQQRLPPVRYQEALSKLD